MKLSNNYLEKLRQAFGLEIVDDNDLELYCKEYFKTIPNLAYQNKRKVNTLSYSVFLNELITPGAFEVVRLKKSILPGIDRFRRVRAAGNVVAKKITWTNDNNLDKSGDYYLFPAETLTLGRADCEDHAFLMASILPGDLGVAYGFWDDGKERYGHAWNIMVIDGELWHVDTVDNVTVTERMSANSRFQLHYVITPRYTFEVRSGVRFGEIAGWN